MTVIRMLIIQLQPIVVTDFLNRHVSPHIIKKAIVYETLGDLAVNRRAIERTYTPKAKTDINQDGNIDGLDDALVDPGDDFGFNEGITYL